MLTTLNKAEKVSCKEAEVKGTYLCKVDTDITLPLMKTKYRKPFTDLYEAWIMSYN